MKLNITGQKNEKRQSAKGSIPLRRKCQFVVLIVGCLVFGYIFVACSKTTDEVQSNINANSEKAFLANATEIPNVNLNINPNADFSEFKHSNPQHDRLPCLLCHKREDNSPVPKLPGHLPCAGCHVQQFADKNNQICTICHTNAQTGELKKFPALKSFNVRFDHAQHTSKTNCATCHKSAENGVKMTMPAGFNAHAACFQCHTAEAKSGEQNIGSCGTCHSSGNPNRSFYSAKAFAFNFAHASHKSMNCAACHNVKAGASRNNQVTAPTTAMHFPPKKTQSCASCHNNQRAFGGDDFSDCRRCHQGNSFKF